MSPWIATPLLLISGNVLMTMAQSASRSMLVLARVSSTNTRRAGSNRC